MSKAILALVASMLLVLGGPPAFADKLGQSDYNHNGYQNVCRVMVRAKICPTGVCPAGTAQWRQAQLLRCMKHNAGVRIRGFRER